MKLVFNGKKVYQASGSTQLDTFKLNEGDRFTVLVEEEGDNKQLTIINLTTNKCYCCHNEELPVVVMVLQFILMDSQEAE